MHTMGCALSKEYWVGVAAKGGAQHCRYISPVHCHRDLLQEVVESQGFLCLFSDVVSLLISR